MLIFTITESLLQKVVNASPVIYQNKTIKDPRKKKAKSGFSCKVRQVMDLTMQIRIFYIVKNCHPVFLKFGDTL